MNTGKLTFRKWNWQTDSLVREPHDPREADAYRDGDSGRKVTVSSYVENILLRHFEQFQDEINTLYESNFQKPV